MKTLKKKSEIYNIIIRHLKKNKSLEEIFIASDMNHVLKAAKKGNVQFLYKHSNENYEEKFTMFFERNNSTPIGFKVKLDIYENYIKKFGEI